MQLLFKKLSRKQDVLQHFINMFSQKKKNSTVEHDFSLNSSSIKILEMKIFLGWVIRFKHHNHEYHFKTISGFSNYLHFNYLHYINYFM